MTTSSVLNAKIRSRLLSSALVVALAGAFSGTLALADFAGRQNLPQPSASADVMSRAVLTKTIAYQKEFALQCTSGFCSVTLPAPGTGNQLTLRRISCLVLATTGSEVRHGTITLNVPGSQPLHQHFSVAMSTSDGTAHTVNSAIDVFARNSQSFNIVIGLSIGDVIVANCTLMGTLGPIA